MKTALRYVALNILWHYTIAYYQAPINPYTYNNIYNNGYYRTIYNKRNALPQYTSLHQPVQTVNQYPNWAGNGPRTPSWALMYNKLAAKRKQEMSDIVKKNKAPYQQPFHHIVTKTFTKINNPSLQIAQRRMLLQKNQALQNKLIFEKNKAEKNRLLLAKTSAAKKKLLMERIKPTNFQTNSLGKTQLLASKNGLIPVKPQRNIDYRILPSIKLNPRLPLMNKQYIPVNYQSIYQHPSSVKPFMPGSITPVLFFNKNPKANSELWKTINTKRRAQISFTRKQMADKKQVANRFTQIPYSITFKRTPVHQLYPIQSRNRISIATPAKNNFLKEYSKKQEFKTTRLLKTNVDKKRKQGTTKLKTFSYTLHPVSSATKFQIKNQALSFTKSRPKNYKKSIITVKGNGTLINSNNTLLQNPKNNKNHITNNTSNNHNNKTLQLYKNHGKIQHATLIKNNNTKINISYGPVFHKKAPLAGTSSWKRHHVFRPSQGNVSNGTEEWEYKRYRIYHRKEPSYYTTSKREHLEIPVVFSNIDDGFDVDDIFNEDEAPVDNVLSDIIEDEDEDLPDPKQKLKIPIVNIETPNTSDLPDDIKNQIQETVQPVYRIIKGKVKSANELREPLANGFIQNKAVKDVLSVRKSEVRGDLFNDYVPNDNEAAAPKMPTDKSKMNEEELEAFKEEQAAESLMKTPDGDKPKTEDPEMLGVGKPPIDLPGKHLSGTLADGSVAGGGLTLPTSHEHREMFNHGDIKPPTVESNKYLDNPPYGSMADLSYAQNVHGKARTPESMSYKGRNERLVDKARISDGELDFHHPVNEMNAFETFHKDKFSDYEKYNNEEQEGNVAPIQRDDMDIHHEHEHEHRYSIDRSDERGSRNEGGRSEYGRHESVRHEGARSEGGRSEGGRSEGGRHEPEHLKPIEYTMKQGEETVDEAINKLQNTDNFDPDKLSASLMDDNKHFHHDREREEEMNPYHGADRGPYHGLESSQYHGSEHSYHGEHSAKDIYHDDPSRVDAPDDHYPPEPIKKFNHMIQSDSIDPAGHMDPAAAMNDESMVDNGLANPLKNGMSMEDMLDPEKAQESANNLEEQVEVAKKLNRELPIERTLEPTPPSPPAMPPPPSNAAPNGDINSHYTKPLEMNDDMMPRNIRGVLKQGGEAFKPFSDVANDPMKLQELTPEDALHALNGKKSLKELLETNRVNDEHYGPPDAVINKQFSGYVKSINPFPIDGRASAPLVPKSENPLLNSRINTLDINKINSIGRLLEVKNDTEEKILNNTSSAQSTSPLLVASSLPNANTTVPSNISSTIITPMKAPDSAGDIHISELQNTTVTKEVVNILESIGQLKPASNFTSPIGNYVKIDNKTTTADTKASVPPVNTTKPEITVTKLDNKSSTALDNKTSSDNSTEDLEEKETKEAVHDLNIAISILEKKLSLISAAKKSGNKKAIYIVDETLRNSKPVTKSIIAMHKHVNHNVIKTTRHKIYHQQPVLNAVSEQPVLGVVPKKVKKHVIHENKYKHKRKTVKHLKKHITNRKLHNKKYKKTKIKKSHHRYIKKKSIL